MVRKLALTLGICALALAASACNTVKGLGRDVVSVGTAGEKVIN